MDKKEGLLSENFDFIEEAAPFSTETLEFQDVNDLDISESEGGGSPWKLIGKVKGCMAPIGVYSRNHRIYENNHWIKVLQNKDLQERIANRRLFGMPSHMQKNIDDEDFREGRISHIVSVLEVRNDNNGKPFLYGEFDILDTPAGRILKAMYEGGAGIYVSTRAAGKLEPIPGDPMNKRVNSDSYFLGGIDCVLNPGFLQARPTFESALTNESVNEEKVEEPVKQDITESTQSSNEELSQLKSQLDQLTKIVEKVVDDVYEEPVEEAKDVEGNEHEIIKSENKDSEHPYKVEHKINGKTVSVSTNDFPADVKKEEEHIKKTYGLKESMTDVAKLLADSTISEEALVEILELLINKKEQA